MKTKQPQIQDCTGIIDLLGCRFSIVDTPTTIEISHPQQRQILLILNAQKYDNSKQMTQVQIRYDIIL